MQNLHTFTAAICGSALTCVAWGNPRDLQLRYSGTTNNLRAVTAGGQQFVAVGDAGTVVTSPDTVQWNLRASGSVADLYGVAFGNGIFVAVGGSTNAEILTSADAVTWTRQTAATTNGLKGIAWGANMFVAVGDQGTILVSSNGVTWNKRPTGLSKTLRAVTCATGPLFMAVGDGGSLFTSTDGLAWAFQNSGVLLDLYCVAATEDRRMADERPFVAAGAQGIAIWSEGGASWNPVSIPTDQDVYAAAAAGAMGNGAVSIVGLAGSAGTFVSSDDAVSWHVQTSGTALSLRGLTTCNGEFLAVGDGGTIRCGRTFLYRPSSVTANLSSVTWGNGKYVAVGGGGTMASSPDGKIWSQETVGSLDFRSVSFGANRFVAVGDGFQAAVSMDGLNWTTNVIPAPSNAVPGARVLHKVAYGNGAFIASGYYSIPYPPAGPPYADIALLSTNGIDWQRLVGLPPGAYYGYYLKASAGPNIFLIAGGSLSSSVDGTTWTTRVPGLYDPNVFGGNLFVALGSSVSTPGTAASYLALSGDGTNWTVVPPNGEVPTTALCYGNGTFLAVGTENLVRCFAESVDGTNWTTGVFFPSTNLVRAVIFGNDSFVAVGDKGLIMQSVPDQSPAQPMLKASMTSSNTILVSWPSPSTGWVLQVNTDFASTNWSDVTTPPADDGTTRCVTVSATGNQFFRLRQ